MALSPLVLQHRREGFALLSGEGIEIGALHEPAPLPGAQRVTYVDALSREDAIALFPEIDAGAVVTPTVVVNLDAAGLGPFAPASQDFVVACHVLEHLANPIGAIAEIFRVLRPGGRAALAVPDKRFTFDRTRALTPFEHLWRDYLDRVTENSDEHYLDFLRATAPWDWSATPLEEHGRHIAIARARREHCHVWDSAAFRELLLLSLPLTGHRATLLFESAGEANGFEYFSVWEKSG
jgi:SAM-dependent methyltransferase